MIVDDQLGKESVTFLNNAYFVPRGGIEPPTPGASNLRSTTELSRLSKDNTIQDPKSSQNRLDNPETRQMFSGGVLGFEQDEEGNFGFSPEKAALGALGVGLGTKVSKSTPQTFKGFTDLSTKLLEKLKGRTTVSRQFIEDLSNSPDLKQPERDLIRRVLGEESGKLKENYG